MVTGTVKRLLDKGFGFVWAEGLALDLFFHSNELNGVTFDELNVGDAVSFDTEFVPRRNASVDTIRHGELLQLHGEQKIVTADSVAAVELEDKVTADLIVRLSRNPADLYQLTPEDFETLIAELYRIDGYTVKLMGSWNQPDGGVDILAMKCDIGNLQFRMAIQCKRYARDRHVRVEPIRALAGVLDRFQAHAGAIITTSDFTKPAKKEAADFFWKLSLVNFENTVDMLRRAELVVRPPITFPRDARVIPEMFLNAINVSRA